MAQCTTTALADAVPRRCVCGARGWFGGFGPVPGVVSLPFPPSCPVCPALRVAGRPVRVSLTLARWYAIPRGLCVPRARSGCPSGSPRVPFACVCARAPAASAPPPPWVVWRAHLARSRHWALVGPFHVVRAPPRVLPRSLASSGVLGGGGPVPFPPYLAWGCGGGGRASPGGGAFHCCEGRLGSGAPPPPTARPLGGLLGSAIHVLWARACGCGGPTLSPWPARPVGAACRGAGPWRSCAGGRAGGEGGPVRRAPRLRGRGGPVGRGVALPRSVPLPSLGRQQSGCHWRRCGHGGRGSHTTPVRARPPSLSAICAASWRVGAGSLVLRGSCGSRRLGRGGGPRSSSSLGRGEGGPSPLPPGVGAGAPAACGPVKGVGGGGLRRGLPAPPLGGGPRYPIPATLMPSAHSPPACACGRGPGAAPGWGRMRGGPWTASLGAPADLNPPSALPDWAVVMGGSWGARPPYCSGAPPCASPKLGPRVAPVRWFGLACRPRPPREQAAGGAGARGVQFQPHPSPPRRGPFWGRGGAPSAPGRRRVAPVAPKLGGGERGGGGWKGRPPRPPAPSGVGLPSVVSGVPPRGILVPWGLPGGRGRQARSGRPPTGQCGGGGGGGRSICAVLGAASPPSAGSGQGVRAPASAVVPPHLGCSGLFGGDAGPPFLSVCLRPLWGLRGRGGGEWGGPLVPWRRLLTAEGRAAWRSRPRGPAIGWGVAPFPHPPLPRA